MKRKKMMLLLYFCCVLTSTLFAQKTEHFTILWDASFSMQEKSLEKEFQLLDAVFKETTTSNVNLIVFANKKLVEQQYQITNGNWNALKTTLEKVTYDGTTIFPKLYKNQIKGTLLYFSDGKILRDQQIQDYKTNAFIISSLSFDYTERTATDSPFYVNILNTPIPDVVSLIYGKTKKKAFFKNHQDNTNFVDENKKIRVYGYVYNKDGYINNVKVESLIEERIQTVSKDNGNYEIYVPNDDVLKFTTPKGKTRILPLATDEDIQMNIEFSDEINYLGEVVVKKKKEKKKIFETDQDETRKYGYSVAQVNSTEFVSGETLAEFIGTNIPGVRFTRRGDVSSIIIRGHSSVQGSNEPLFFIDGAPLSSASANTIDPITLDNVRVLKGLAATSVYGPNAVNGVILLTTKIEALKEKEKPKNLYNSELALSDMEASYKTLDTLLSAGRSIDDAYSIYLKERSGNAESVSFYFNAFRYFEEKKAYDKALRVISNIEELYSKKPKELLALAFKYDEKQFHKQALAIYRVLAQMKPNSVQYLRNVAASLNRNNKIKESFAIYQKLINSKEINFIPEKLFMAIQNEVVHLYMKHPKTFGSIELSPEMEDNFNADRRIVFEWNDASANFELQPISPDKLYYNWGHVSDVDEEKITNEYVNGYGMEEFLLINAEKGDWYFNVTKPETAKNSEHAVLKLTIYKNYGKANESRVTKVIPLNFEGKSITVAKIRI